MPHVILKGLFSLQDWIQVSVPVVEDKKDWLIKFQDLYLEKQGCKAITSVITVEEGHPQSYYMRLVFNSESERLSIHLDPATDPIKTRGVKRSVAFMAENVVNLFPHMQLDQSNIEEYLVWENTWSA